MRQIFLSGWISGVRGRSFQVAFLLGVLLIGVAYLAGSFSPRQPQTVVLDVGLSGLRFSLVLLALFWVQELVGREIDRRTVFFVLTYPVPRSHYVIGRYISVLALLAVALLIQGILLWIAVLIGRGGYQQTHDVHMGWPYAFALFALWLDVAVVAAFALWIATLATVAILPFALGMAFAIASKGLGPVHDYLRRGAEGDKELVATYRPLLDASQWVLPDLSRLDWRVWPMYGTSPEAELLVWGVAMALAYASLMIVLAVRSFGRREFA